jgi:hypothetical protein
LLFPTFRNKAEKHCRLAFTYVLETFALFFGDFYMDLYSFDSDEAMK